MILTNFEVAMLVSNFTGFFIQLFFFEGILERKKFSKMTFAIILIGVLSIEVLNNQLLEAGLAFTAAGLGLWTGFALFCYTGSLTVRLLSGAILAAIGVLSELIVFLLGTTVYDISSDKLHEGGFELVVMTVAARLMMLVIVMVIVRVTKRKLKTVTLSQWLIFMFVIVMSLFIIYIIYGFSLSGTENQGRIIVAVIVVLTINIIIYLLIESVSRFHGELEEVRYANKQYEIQTDHYKDVIESHKETRRMWHDMNNHLLTIKSQLERGAPEKAADYVAELGNRIHVLFGEMISANLEIDAILSEKFRKASAQGIKVTHNIMVGSDTGISSVDMSIMVGNAVDNAIEACERVEIGERFVDIVMRRDGMNFVMVIKNSMNKDSIRPSRDGFRSSKQSRSENHGYGLYNINRIVDRYSGHMMTQVSDAVFELDIVIPV